jgi:hypothetical protein
MAFKAITLNTPAADPAHILAEDDAAIYESLFGSDKVLNIGGKLAATTISNNQVRITDGVVVVGGHVGRIYKGDYEDMTIENGVSGQNRNDLIVARYLVGSDGGADTYGLAVIKGTAGTTAEDPVYVQGDLYNGDQQRDAPLYRVRLEGLSIVAVEPMFEVGQTIGELEEAVEALNSNKVSGWGALENVSNPYAPDVDGYIRVYFSPSGNTDATVYVTQNGNGYFYGSSSGGSNFLQYFPVKAGNTYQGQASQPGTIQLAFMPLQKE